MQLGGAEVSLGLIVRECDVEIVHAAQDRTSVGSERGDEAVGSPLQVVPAREVFEHLRDYPIRALEESMRILRTGGHLYFTTPNQAYVVNRMRLAAGLNVQSPLPDWITGVAFARHAREYTFDEIESLMSRVGFVVTRSESRHFHLHAGRQTLPALAGKRVVAAVAAQRRTLGPQIVVVAEKPDRSTRRLRNRERRVLADWRRRTFHGEVLGAHHGLTLGQLCRRRRLPRWGRARCSFALSGR